MKYLLAPFIIILVSISTQAQIGKWTLKKYTTEPDLTESMSSFEKEAAKIYLKNKTKGSYYDVHKDGTFEAKGIYKDQMVDQKGTWELSDDKKKPIEEALEELKTAYETKDLAVITPALDKINEAWKVASEEMYKAQADAQQAGGEAPQGDASAEADGDNVEDVDFEEVK